MKLNKFTKNYFYCYEKEMADYFKQANVEPIQTWASNENGKPCWIFPNNGSVKILQGLYIFTHYGNEAFDKFYGMPPA